MRLRKIRLKFLVITGFFTFIASGILYFNNLQLKSLPSKKDYQNFLEIYQSNAQINLFLARELNGSNNDIQSVDTEIENLKNLISLLKVQYSNDFFLKTPLNKIVEKTEIKLKMIQNIRQNFKILKNSHLNLRKNFFENRKKNKLILNVDKRDILPEIYSDILFSQVLIQKDLITKIEENINIINQSIIFNKTKTIELDEFLADYKKVYFAKTSINKSYESLLKVNFEDEFRTIDEILLKNQSNAIFRNDKFQFILMGFLLIYFVFVFRMLNFY